MGRMRQGSVLAVCGFIQYSRFGWGRWWEPEWSGAVGCGVVGWL